ncbi:MAG: ABC transporter permease [Bifidobacteriaceae bacterium]|jgi:ABC-2 type transport system permease protein|nr:ABC transporter permease [Bifidobacteriaceae bacterium]
MTATTFQPTQTFSLTFPGVVKSEWIKLMSVRWTWWCAVLQLVLGTGFTYLMSMTLTKDDAVISGITDGMPVLLANQGLVFVGTVTTAVFGVLAASSEYSSGSIRSTLAAVPHRGTVLGAKMLVTSFFMLVLGLVAESIGAGLASWVCSMRGFDTPIGAEGWGMFAGAVFAMVVWTLMSLGLGMALRSSAGGIATALGLFLLLDMILGLARSNELIATLGNLTPLSSGSLMFMSVVTPGEDSVLGGYWGGAACLAGWVVLCLTAGYVVLKKRDA